MPGDAPPSKQRAKRRKAASTRKKFEEGHCLGCNTWKPLEQRLVRSEAAETFELCNACRKTHLTKIIQQMDDKVDAWTAKLNTDPTLTQSLFNQHGHLLQQQQQRQRQQKRSDACVLPMKQQQQVHSASDGVPVVTEGSSELGSDSPSVHYKEDLLGARHPYREPRETGTTELTSSSQAARIQAHSEHNPDNNSISSNDNTRCRGTVAEQEDKHEALDEAGKQEKAGDAAEERQTHEERKAGGDEWAKQPEEVVGKAQTLGLRRSQRTRKKTRRLQEELEAELQHERQQRQQRRRRWEQRKQQQKRQQQGSLRRSQRAAGQSQADQARVAESQRHACLAEHLARQDLMAEWMDVRMSRILHLYCGSDIIHIYFTILLEDHMAEVKEALQQLCSELRLLEATSEGVSSRSTLDGVVEGRDRDGDEDENDDEDDDDDDGGHDTADDVDVGRSTESNASPVSAPSRQSTSPKHVAPLRTANLFLVVFMKVRGQLFPVGALPVPRSLRGTFLTRAKECVCKLLNGANEWVDGQQPQAVGVQGQHHESHEPLRRRGPLGMARRHGYEGERLQPEDVLFVSSLLASS